MQKHFKTKLAVAVVAILAIAAAGVAVFADGGSKGSGSARQGSGGKSQLREVTVYAGHEPAPSKSSKSMRAQLLAGQLPKGTTVATVLTDENCTPDSAGISHCTNKIQLRGGKKLTLRHPHNMMQVECLGPGERVLIKPA